jgi:hypothetical protein
MSIQRVLFADAEALPEFPARGPDPQSEWLALALEVAVPLYAAEMREWSWEQRRDAGLVALPLICGPGAEGLMVRTGDRQADRKAFAAIARAVAVLAMHRGGIPKFLARRWLAGEANGLPPGVLHVLPIEAPAEGPG